MIHIDFDIYKLTILFFCIFIDDFVSLIMFVPSLKYTSLGLCSFTFALSR